ncbi:uncharacterized protein LOC127281607 [Leptopilina boulardi]|uniref:uncharacterized protein LOC127281607 n=1 Tax=Leptopilina boulardi TaxID=63433 RepID=UPI0021F62ABE|nr:uncharacterized protein LOC127281607 [Leptopilina boulardi]
MTDIVPIKRKLDSDDDDDDDDDEEEEELDTMELSSYISIDENSIDIKHEEPIVKKARGKRRGGKNFQQEWFDEFPLWKEWVIRLANDSQFHCKYCDKTMLCGRKEILNHEKTVKHIKKREISEKMIRYGCIVNTIKNVTGLLPMNNSCIVTTSPPPTSTIGTTTDDLIDLNTGLTFRQKVHEAENKITEFFLANDIPFNLSAKVVGLFREIEPLVLKDIKLSSSKMSLVAKEIYALKTGEKNVLFPRSRKKKNMIKLDTKH